MTGLGINRFFKGTQTQSTQLHSHPMEDTLYQVLGIKQSDFGMHTGHEVGNLQGHRLGQLRWKAHCVRFR